MKTCRFHRHGTTHRHYALLESPRTVSKLKATEGIVHSFQSCEPLFLMSAFFRAQSDTKESGKDQDLTKSSRKTKKPQLVEN